MRMANGVTASTRRMRVTISSLSLSRTETAGAEVRKRMAQRKTVNGVRTAAGRCWRQKTRKRLKSSIDIWVDGATDVCLLQEKMRVVAEVTARADSLTGVKAGVAVTEVTDVRTTVGVVSQETTVEATLQERSVRMPEKTSLAEREMVTARRGQTEEMEDEVIVVKASEETAVLRVMAKDRLEGIAEIVEMTIVHAEMVTDLLVNLTDRAREIVRFEEEGTMKTKNLS